MWQCPKQSDCEKACVHTCLQVNKLNINVQIQSACGKCNFLKVSEYQRMQLPPVKQKWDSHTQQQLAVKAKSQGFQESQAPTRI